MKKRISAVLMLVAGIAASIRAQTPQTTPMPYTAIHQPEFVAASEATFLHDDDILLGVTSGSVAKAYPAADLSQHGAVFDKMPEGPISVTWCGVCNTGLVFRAEVKGRTLHFQYDRMVGANEVQKDLETGTSWQQATGEAIDGPLKGTRLTLYPVVRTTWGEWRKRYPQTMVLKPLPGYAERMPNLSKRIKDVTRRGSHRGAERRARPRQAIAGARNRGRTRGRSRDRGVPVLGAAHRSCRQRPCGRTADCHRPSALIRYDDGIRRARQRQGAHVSSGE
jgi:hypothetical protein